MVREEGGEGVEVAYAVPEVGAVFEGGVEEDDSLVGFDEVPGDGEAWGWIQGSEGALEGMFYILRHSPSMP